MFCLPATTIRKLNAVNFVLYKKKKLSKVIPNQTKSLFKSNTYVILIKYLQYETPTLISSLADLIQRNKP